MGQRLCGGYLKGGKPHLGKSPAGVLQNPRIIPDSALMFSLPQRGVFRFMAV
ncbi:proline/glycine betaine ABC superfamily ATP binding cassette transporter, membrane protein [Neisseria shayeganii 871]|uniref:Proline/glycine betaine ABC superfamily ATP binding cassette transporter, membrane protein n=1 Tax=Neisseria shayeganii 871 TaxID=1032488 RepID=G4CEV3_9NEIS|nr:proline/glycine betaine ABC superfamily ATP binding cassette transporter, membrane protein [Neisseria shayeganii 871]